MKMINGLVAPGFEPVLDEFERNFSHRGELGAACAVYYGGEKVIDIWGGLRDSVTRHPWEEDTLVTVFSTTKGLASMTLAHAHSRGLIDYNERVATYWKEFAQNGKDVITVSQLLAHQAGLCALNIPLDYETLKDPDSTAAVLARQTPAWIPGTRQGYHAQTLGLYEGELIRRIDPQHRTLGQYFQDEIARPLDLDFYIGLPDGIPESRIARLEGFPPWHLLLNIRKLGWPLISGLLNPKSLTAQAFQVTTCFKDIESYNQRSLQAIEFPSANGIGTARSIAAVYSDFATGGKRLGMKTTTMNALAKPPSSPANGSFDEVLRAETAFALGFLKPSPSSHFGNGATAFGMPGTGGSFAFADPDKQIGYAYVMNKCGFYPVDDPREKAIREKVYQCLSIK